MTKPILVIMAAGVGSRFGGFKQMAPFGAHGEGLIHYSLYDALQAGFRRVLFVVNRRIHEDFRAFLGSGVGNRMDVGYVFQEIDTLPAGCLPVPGRTKPWGTAHAVMCCGSQIDAPFCAINGDDLYGRDALQKIFAFLNAAPAGGSYAMVGFLLGNTLSETGFVSRGQCFVTAEGYLQNVIERTRIISTTDGALFTLDGQTYHRLPEDAVASMNLWGFTPDFLDEVTSRFPAFYRQALQSDPLKAEYFLPAVVGSLLSEQKVSVKVLQSKDRWYGVTNPSDRAAVESALRDMTRQGIYPERLWPD